MTRHHAMALVALLAASIACGGAKSPATAATAVPDERERAACEADTTGVKESEPGGPHASLTDNLVGRPIVSVSFAGFRRTSLEGLRKLAGLNPGNPLDHAAVAAAIRGLWAGGELEDVQVDVQPSGDGAAVRFMVRERPRVSRVFAPNVPDNVRDEMTAALGMAPGRALDVAGLYEGRRALAKGLAARGATFDVKLHPRRDNEVDVCLVFNLHAPPRP